MVGADNVSTHVEPTMGAEDFAFMLQAKPGCYCLHRQRRRRAPRSAATASAPACCTTRSYDFNDDLIPLGATYWVRLVEMGLPQT